MATVKPFNQADLDTATKLRDSLKEKLAGSPSSYSEGAASSSDLNTDIELMAAEKKVAALTSQKEKEKWYPAGTDDVTTQGKPKAGLFTRILSGLGAPLRWEAGAVDAMLGGGEGKGIIENANYNMKTGGQTYGDLMRERNVPNWIAAPAGFALDVMGDPINIASMGTASLVGKVGAGLVKGTMKEGLVGGLKAAGAGAVSSIAGDALGLVKAIPFGGGKALAANEGGVFQKIARKVAEKGMQYDELTGINQLESAGKNFGGLTNVKEGGFTLGKGLESVIREIPGGDTLVEKFKYSPADWFDKTKAVSEIHKVLEKEGLTSSVPVNLNRVVEMMDNPLNVDLMQPKKVTSFYDDKLAEINKMILDTDYVAKNGTKNTFLVADDATEFEARLAQEAMKSEEARDSIIQFAKLNKEKTGIDWFDKTTKFIKDNVSKFKIGNVELGKNALTAIGISDDIFKASKVLLNPASRMNANAGNVLFTTIYGFDPLRVYLGQKSSSLKKAVEFITGNDGGAFALTNFFDGVSDFADFASTNPNAVVNSLGMTASSMAGRTFIESIVREGKNMGLITSASSESDLIRKVMSMGDELKASLQSTAGVAEKATTEGGFFETLNKSVKAKKDFLQKSQLETAYNKIKGTAGSEVGGPTSYLANEIGDTSIKKFYEIKKEWAEKAAGGSIPHKILDSLITKQIAKGANKFGLVDQAHKLNLSVYMTKAGLTESELTAVAKNIKNGITDDDVRWFVDKSGKKVPYTYEDGQKIFRLTWNKAVQIADDVYMNYAAMPPFVRMMRSAGIVGMPFGAFTYGAISKIGKNVVSNPQMFNKVGFATHEFAGQKGPVEKAALDTPYYSWYDSPSMVKLPFFKDNPLYLNLANWIPYYSLNMFSPSQRN